MPLALPQKDKLRTTFYPIRFIAFLLIILGIIDNNRSTRPTPDPQDHRFAAIPKGCAFRAAKSRCVPVSFASFAE